MRAARPILGILLSVSIWLPLFAQAAPAGAAMEFIDAQIAAHPGESGAYVLETGQDALLARAWLVDHAQRSIDVQYFIWSTDRIGILAAEALVRAADRGVRVRVLVDDLMIDAPDKSLLALARHSNISIRIYNPKTSGAPLQKVFNLIGDFRGVNQRMHDKTLIIDGKLAVTGGRNMAAEYYDYNGEYNFRDRDVLVLGKVAGDMRGSFENFWDSQLSVKVEKLYGGFGLLRKHARVDDEEVKKVYGYLSEYANNSDNFSPEVRAAINAMPSAFERIANKMVWTRMEFIGDAPGKNESRWTLGGGGQTTSALARLVDSARDRIVIQSPYLVLSDKAIALFRKTLARGVRVRIHTNSLASTDNLPAFSGYRSQRDELLKMGLEIYEYKPDPAVQQSLMRKLGGIRDRMPIFALHAKTMVVDSKIAYIGTFNFDPRSENLNTEVGMVIHSENLARAVESAIETDMGPDNSWNAADDPDRYVPAVKRNKVRLLQLAPIKPLL
jgi:putative cardiolipin synthase